MEKIFFFIIIMIISSLLSKNKKKRVTSYTKKEKTTYFDDKGRPVNEPKPVTDLKGLLDRMKNIDTYMQETQSSEPEVIEEYVPEPEILQEENKYTPESSADEKMTGGWEIPEREESKLQSARYEEEDSYRIEERSNKFRDMVSGRQKLKDAIIVSEILKRRYT